MSWNMYYLPCIEKSSYSEDCLYCYSMYPQEKLLVSEESQNQKFDNVSQINNYTLDSVYELSNKCTDSYEMESCLNSYLPAHNSDGIYSSALCESNYDSGFYSNEQVVDLSADRVKELPHSEKFSKTFGHCNVHASEHPFICKICKKQFGSRSSLANHSKTHVQDRPHTCQECKKSFKRNCDLQKHIETHSNKMNYNCEICKMQFLLKRELTRHMLVHSGEKPYVCEHCGKVFRRKTFLTRHLKVHTDGRDFTCKICSKKFQSKKHLTEHIVVHSSENLHVCECFHCGKLLEASKSPFHRQDKENNTTISKDNMPLHEKRNSDDADEQNTSFSLTSIDDTSFQAQPSNNFEHDISTNFGSGCTSNVVPMSSKFLITPAVENRSGAPDASHETAIDTSFKASVQFLTQWEEANYRPNDSILPCSIPIVNSDYFSRILERSYV